MTPLPSINPVYAPPPQLSAPPAVGEGTGASFKEFMLQSIGEVNGMQQEAQAAVEQLATGGDANLAEVMTAVQKADMSFRLMMQMRNKLVQAYQQIQDIRI